MIAFFLLLFLLDVQHPPKVESPLNNFVVIDNLDNSATTGCTMNPGSGNNFNADMISVDWAGLDDPHEGDIPLTRQNGPEFADDAIVTPMAMPYLPPGQPNPNPDPPPVTATPEPPTAAILGISAVTLLYLLFGRKRGKRLVRR